MLQSRASVAADTVHDVAVSLDVRTRRLSGVSRIVDDPRWGKPIVRLHHALCSVQGAFDDKRESSEKLASFSGEAGEASFSVSSNGYFSTRSFSGHRTHPQAPCHVPQTGRGSFSAKFLAPDGLFPTTLSKA